MLAFNKARAKFYPFNEVYLEAPKKAINLPEGAPTKHRYVRLDSYNPHTGEIVSREYPAQWGVERDCNSLLKRTIG